MNHKIEIATLKAQVQHWKTNTEFWIRQWHEQREATGRVAWSEYYRGANAQQFRNVYDQKYGKSFYGYKKQK